MWGKASTAAQIAYVLFAVGHEAGITPLIVATILGWITFALTLWSGIDYFIKCPGEYHEGNGCPTPSPRRFTLKQSWSTTSKTPRNIFSDALLEIHYAHTRMLAGCGLLTREEESKLLAALHGLDRNRIAAAHFDGTSEDLFFFIEGLLEEAAGRELAGKMHTARSRNDIAVTLYRMTARREILETARALAELRACCSKFAAAHVMTVMPAHTHTQPAQPTTLAHYLLAAIEFLARDSARLQAAFARVNLSPMGAAAITTSGFPIDRDEPRVFSDSTGSPRIPTARSPRSTTSRKPRPPWPWPWSTSASWSRICSCGRRASSDICA